MTDSGPTVKIVAAASAGATVLVFAQVTLAVLIPVIIGVALVMLGIAIAYRAPAAIGLLAVLATMAFSVEVPTLTDAEGVLRAAISVFAPAITLAWAALSAEPGDERSVPVVSRPNALLVGTAAALLLAVPLFVFLVGVFLPTVSIRISTMAEVSILLACVTASGIILNRSAPKRTETAPKESAVEEET